MNAGDWWAVLALGSPHSRGGCGGGLQLALRHDSAKLRYLGIHSSLSGPDRARGRMVAGRAAAR